MLGVETGSTTNEADAVAETITSVSQTLEPIINSIVAITKTASELNGTTTDLVSSAIDIIAILTSTLNTSLTNFSSIMSGLKNLLIDGSIVDLVVSLKTSSLIVTSVVDSAAVLLDAVTAVILLSTAENFGTTIENVVLSVSLLISDVTWLIENVSAVLSKVTKNVKLASDIIAEIVITLNILVSTVLELTYGTIKTMLSLLYKGAGVVGTVVELISAAISEFENALEVFIDIINDFIGNTVFVSAVPSRMLDASAALSKISLDMINWSEKPVLVEHSSFNLANKLNSNGSKIKSILPDWSDTLNSNWSDQTGVAGMVSMSGMTGMTDMPSGTTDMSDMTDKSGMTNISDMIDKSGISEMPGTTGLTGKTDMSVMAEISGSTDMMSNSGMTYMSNMTNKSGTTDIAGMMDMTGMTNMLNQPENPEPKAPADIISLAEMSTLDLPEKSSPIFSNNPPEDNFLF